MLDLRSVLVAIQELHKPYEWSDGILTCDLCLDADEVAMGYPCRTRQLADKGLEGERG